MHAASTIRHPQGFTWRTGASLRSAPAQRVYTVEWGIPPMRRFPQRFRCHWHLPPLEIVNLIHLGQFAREGRGRHLGPLLEPSNPR